MPARVLILDTSVLCCLLSVPGKETCGSDDDRWDHDRISALIDAEVKRASLLVLPLATIIETGNHIAQAKRGDRFEVATGLAAFIASTAQGRSPWAAFTEQSGLWEPARLETLAETWPRLAVGGTSIGDATIKDVAEFYAKAGYEVEIVTGDAGLKAYEPLTPPRIPRRRGGPSAGR
jgi:hypothetical protein